VHLNWPHPLEGNEHGDAEYRPHRNDWTPQRLTPRSGSCRSMAEGFRGPDVAMAAVHCSSLSGWGRTTSGRRCPRRPSATSTPAHDVAITAEASAMLFRTLGAASFAGSRRKRDHFA